MSKQIKPREFSKIFSRLGCSERKCKGSHSIFTCACGKHTITVTTGHSYIDVNVPKRVKNVFSCMNVEF